MLNTPLKCCRFSFENENLPPDDLCQEQLIICRRGICTKINKQKEYGCSWQVSFKASPMQGSYFACDTSLICCALKVSGEKILVLVKVFVSLATVLAVMSLKISLRDSSVILSEWAKKRGPL